MPENWFAYENGMEGLPMNMLPEPLSRMGRRAI